MIGLSYLGVSLNASNNSKILDGSIGSIAFPSLDVNTVCKLELEYCF